MKIRSLTIILLFLTLLCVVGCSEKSNDSKKEPSSVAENEDVQAIALTNDVSVRLQPQFHSSRIGALMKGDSVEILGHSVAKSTIAKKSRYWYHIRMSNGVAGWAFGSNLKILKEGDDFSIEEYKKQVAAEKVEKVVKYLTGKWWSVTRSGNFTSHSLVMYADKKYKSVRNGRVIKGTFEVDLDKGLVLFSKGTTFGDDLTIIVRGQEVLIEKDTEKYKYRFRKISTETDDELKPAEISKESSEG